MERGSKNNGATPKQRRTSTGQDNDLTPQTRPFTRSRTLSTGETTPTPITAEKRKRSPESGEVAGNMSKKTATDNEPSNAQIMRAISSMNSKFDKLPTLQDLNKLETDLHLSLIHI